MPTRKDILNLAKEKVGDCSWSYFLSREAKNNSKVKFGMCEWKCNLFVYEILLDLEIDIGTPNKISDKRWKIKAEGKTERPPTTSQWYNGQVSHFKEIKREQARGGDICTDGSHIGIVSDFFERTISAAQTEIVSSDWGYRDGQENVKFFTLA